MNHGSDGIENIPASNTSRDEDKLDLEESKSSLGSSNNSNEPYVQQKEMSFVNFLSKSTEKENTTSQSSEAGLVSALRADITAATNACLLAYSPTISFPSILGFKSKQEVIQEFSQKVSEYASSEEVISALSEEIGSPEEGESEDQFVDRAKAALKTILRKKFRM